MLMQKPCVAGGGAEGRNQGRWMQRGLILQVQAAAQGRKYWQGQTVNKRTGFRV